MSKNHIAKSQRVQIQIKSDIILSGENHAEWKILLNIKL